VIVTGASSGIGRATALAFAAAGAQVVLAARSEGKLQALSDEIVEKGGRALVVPTDVGRPEQVQQLVECTMEKFGCIDVLVNNAGYGLLGLAEKVSLAEVRALFDVNFFGAVACTQAVLPHMLRQGWGQIVMVSSVAGLIGTPITSVYAASKFALNGWSQALRAEVANRGVDVIVVCPSFTSGTHFTDNAVKVSMFPGKDNPLQRQSADDVAKAILQAARRRQHLAILTHSARLAVFLNHCCPRLVDWALAMYVRHSSLRTEL